MAGNFRTNTKDSVEADGDHTRGAAGPEIRTPDTTSDAAGLLAPAKPADLPVHLECVSWHLVQHHLAHGALRFEEAALDYMRRLAPTDNEAHFCLATLVDAPIDVVGTLRYRITADDLYFADIHVREASRQRGIGRRMLTEVVTHPTCIHLARLHWMAETAGCETLIHHLEWLRDNVRRRCGTRFRLIVHSRGKEPAEPG